MKSDDEPDLSGITEGILNSPKRLGPTIGDAHPSLPPSRPKRAEPYGCENPPPPPKRRRLSVPEYVGAIDCYDAEAGASAGAMDARERASRRSPTVPEYVGGIDCCDAEAGSSAGGMGGIGTRGESRRLSVAEYIMGADDCCELEEGAAEEVYPRHEGGYW